MTKTNNWSVYTADGNEGELCNGISTEVDARRAAQREANERGEAVYLRNTTDAAEGDDEYVGELVCPTVSAHAEREGRADYDGRAEDVARGAEAPEWAWPFSGADEAYVNAVGAGTICKALGLDESEWDEIATEWCAAFRRGYEEAGS